MNKYEQVLIAAREARRLNDVAKLSGRELRVRPTTVAWERLTQGKIKHTYEPEAGEPPRPEDGA
ncbi:MAG TPA: DNA-directed RNA polymerase subunit omega [Dongiaceae bacterium]|jgi:DNA-directed RNA polymerase subunit K/omega|nr:DNA-directed RNA polymerase subunit omega [Dongiaceae bacterium]